MYFCVNFGQMFFWIDQNWVGGVFVFGVFNIVFQVFSGSGIVLVVDDNCVIMFEDLVDQWEFQYVIVVDKIYIIVFCYYDDVIILGLVFGCDDDGLVFWRCFVNFDFDFVDNMYQQDCQVIVGVQIMYQGELVWDECENGVDYCING